MKETWKRIDGFQNYEVSNLGSVRSLHGGKTRVLKPFFRGSYHAFSLRADGKTVSRYCHHLVWEAFNGPRTKGMQLNHINGIKTTNGLENLEEVSPRMNSRHCYLNQLRKRTNIGAKPLSQEDVKAIRFFYIKGKKGHVSALAKIFDRQVQTIALIAKGSVSGYFPR